MTAIPLARRTFPASAADDVLAGNCDGNGNGFNFTLTTEGQSYPQTSGQAGDGQAYWDNVPGGSYQLDQAWHWGWLFLTAFIVAV